jgi:hypothetical protein
MSRETVPAFQRNFGFNAQHSPMGAFLSFTCGHPTAGGGIGREIGKPAERNIYVGAKRGDRHSIAPIRCLPFIRRSIAARAPTADGPILSASYRAEQVPASSAASSIAIYEPDEIRRHYGWATDTWATADLAFAIYTPFGSIPEPGSDLDRLRISLLPAVIATLTLDNRTGDQPKTGVFAIDFVEPGTRLIHGGDAHPTKRGFGWRRQLGVLGVIEDSNPRSAEDLFAFQRWSVAEGVSDINPVYELGTCGGLAFEVPPRSTRTLVLGNGAYLDGVVTTGLEGRYSCTRLYSGLDEVLATALERADELQARSHRLDSTLLTSALWPDQQFNSHMPREFIMEARSCALPRNLYQCL